jgi:hypothetical protein
MRRKGQKIFLTVLLSSSHATSHDNRSNVEMFTIQAFRKITHSQAQKLWIYFSLPKKAINDVYSLPTFYENSHYEVSLIARSSVMKCMSTAWLVIRMPPRLSEICKTWKLEIILPIPLPGTHPIQLSYLVMTPPQSQIFSSEPIKCASVHLMPYKSLT